ncbi:MAG: ABC transporter permease [Anaerolineaceae bacterium]|nr:ABC transporter permease [Anaerolineaceae bacterium]
MGDLFTLPVLLGIIYYGIRFATPYLFAAIGETFAQRSGVLNLGVEGMMLMGAYTGFYVAATSGNLWAGLLAAAIVGGLMGLLMAVISVTFQATQGISGIGLHILGLGLSTLLFTTTMTGVATIIGFPSIRIPLLGDIPYIGDILFNHNVLVYTAFLLVPISNWILYKTTFGLQVRAVGQSPQAADTLGVSVKKIRYITVTLGGVLAGIAGASLSIALINVFQENLTNGMGFIAVALVYFGAWRPYGVLLGSLLFSFVNAFQQWVQLKGVAIPADVAVMMPYILTIVVLAFSARRSTKPAALTKKFERGEA